VRVIPVSNLKNRRANDAQNQRATSTLDESAVEDHERRKRAEDDTKS
jgi:hypothetical protein